MIIKLLASEYRLKRLMKNMCHKFFLELLFRQSAMTHCISWIWSIIITTSEHSPCCDLSAASFSWIGPRTGTKMMLDSPNPSPDSSASCVWQSSENQRKCSRWMSLLFSFHWLFIINRGRLFKNHWSFGTYLHLYLF